MRAPAQYTTICGTLLNTCVRCCSAVCNPLVAATGAVAKRLPFKGSDEEGGFWNKGISACAVCDGAAPIFRNKPIAVIGGGDSAMEEALFLTKYGSQVRHRGIRCGRFLFPEGGSAIGWLDRNLSSASSCKRPLKS